MNILSLKKLFLFGALLYIPCQSMAWGMLGHRVVGQVAESYLSKKAKGEIKNILGTESMAMASNWADFIKSEPAYNYLGNWHYINLPAGLKSEQLEYALKQDTVTDAYTKILFLSSEIQLTWFGQNTNLHRVWDSDLIESQDLSYTEYTNSINFIDKYKLQSLQLEGPAQWITDSYKISESLYSKVKSGDKLSYRYIYDNLETANQQLLKGGIHLAALLNNIFIN
jgi:hypothetical protein